MFDVGVECKRVSDALVRMGFVAPEIGEVNASAYRKIADALEAIEKRLAGDEGGE